MTPLTCLDDKVAMRSRNEGSVHGSTVVLSGLAILIIGQSGAGKSSLAAQLIALGAELIADDLTLLTRDPRGIICASPRPSVPKIALRGIGVISVPLAQPTPMGLIVHLGAFPIERLPSDTHVDMMGHSFPILRLPYQADLGSKIYLFAQSLCRNLPKD